jgi:type II secretory pathway pseudopilin PulG
MVTCTIMGILVNLALPAVATIRRKADAARVVADIHTIRIAALNHFAELQYFPATQPWASPPASMSNMLPQGFQWSYKTAEYRWSRWSLPNGLPTAPGQTVLIGVEVRSPDQKFMAAIKGLYKGAVAFGTSTQVTFVIE